MATKSDIDQILKGVRKIVREEVETEVKSSNNNLLSRMLDWRISIQRDIRELADRMKNVEVSTNNLEKGQQEIKKQLVKIDKKHDKLFHFLDNDWSKLSREVKAIEDKLES